MAKLYRSQAEVFLTFHAPIGCTPGATRKECAYHDLKDVDAACRAPNAVLRELGKFARRFQPRHGWPIQSWVREGLAPGYRELKLEVGVPADYGIDTKGLRAELLAEMRQLARVRDELNSAVLEGRDIKIAEAEKDGRTEGFLFTSSNFVYWHLKAQLPKEVRGGTPRPPVDLTDGTGGVWRYPSGPDTRGFSEPEAEFSESLFGTVRTLSRDEPHAIIVRDEGRRRHTVRLKPEHYSAMARYWETGDSGIFRVRPRRWTIGGFVYAELFDLEYIYGR